MRGGDRLEERELPQRRPAGGDEAFELGDQRIGVAALLEAREAGFAARPRFSSQTPA